MPLGPPRAAPRVKLIVHILRELTSAFLFAVFGMFVVALPVIAVAAVYKLQGVNTLGVLGFLPLLIGGLVPYVLPLSYLLAVVTVYGRLAADNEWTAIRMAGIWPLKMLVPGAILAAACSAGTWWLLADKLPEARRLRDDYRVTALREQARQVPPNETELKFGEFYLVSAWREGDAFIDAWMHVPAIGKEPARTLRARSVRFEFTADELFVHLRGAHIVSDAKDFSNENPTIRLNLAELLGDKTANLGKPRHLTSGELAQRVADPATKPEQRTQWIFEIHDRRALSSTYWMFLLLGAPTGLILRRGTQLGALAAAVGYALLYYLLSMRLSKELASSRVIPPEFGAWLVVAVGCVCGLFLLRKALRT